MLERLPADERQLRQALAARYDTLLADLPVTLPKRLPHRQSAWHLYPVQVAPESRRAVFETMRAAGIGVQVHYIPVHLQPYYRDLGFRPGDYPHTEAYYRGAFSLPLYPSLTEGEQDSVVTALSNALA